MSLGLRIELERRAAGRPDTFESQRGLPPWSRGLRVPRLGIATAVAMAAILAALAAVGAWSAPDRAGDALAASLDDVESLILAAVGLWTTFAALRWMEGALLGSTLTANVPWVRFRHATVHVDPACWRLGTPVAVPVTLLGLAVALLAAGLFWRHTFPGSGVGIASGSILYLIQALYPLRPGPGAALLGDALGIRDLPSRLRWALLTRFVPVPSGLSVDGGRALAVGALSFALWVAATGGALSLLARPAQEGATLAGALWRAVFSILLILYAAWLVWRLLELLVSAFRLRGAGDLRPVDPSDEIRDAWRTSNPLVRHLPALLDARWQWGRAPRGAALTRYGERDGRFLWLARGRASVIGRSPQGDPVLLAELREGAGVGEIGLLDEGPRTADVVVSQESVVAILERDDFDRVVDDRVRERFRDLVHASQALARSPALWGLRAEERDAWLAAGRPQRHGPGEVVIREGEDARWIGLIVHGRLRVSEHGVDVAELGRDDVVGEIAYLSGGRRSATVHAENDVLIWRWDPAFLDSAVGPGPLREELLRLAESRS